ncbi:MAG: DMT family transporter [Treponema sp.]|uniref:DMT family transporter n=1 Tax=Treponema sp. TaxID=166 RepID=UPI00298D9DE2|nr:DMT family transporter [Treponema sp.]MBR5932560.1 DMT family transporter [Treponema sp.]
MVKIEGALALAVCALCWSLAGVFLKYVDINSFATAGFRSFFAFLTLMAFTRRFPRLRILESALDVQAPHAGQTKINVKATIYLWLSAASYAVTMILFCLANKLTYSANAVLLQYTFPIWIIIFGPLILGEKNSKIDYVAIAGVIVGMLLFFAENIFAVQDGKFKDTQVLGNLLALFSGITFAGTTIFQRKQSMISPMDNTSFDSFMLAQLITFAFGAPFVFLTSDGVPGVKSLVFLILLGCIQMGFANIAYSIGIKKVRALSASLITMIEPLMNPVWVFVFVHEIPGFLCVLGGILIIACVVLREVFNKRKAA